MKIKASTIKEIKGQIKKIVRKKLPKGQYELFLFGSRVTGDARLRSDIDIGISGLKPIPLSVMGRMKEEIEKIPTLYKIDLVDFSKVGLRFQKEALKHKEIL